MAQLREGTLQYVGKKIAENWQLAPFGPLRAGKLVQTAPRLRHLVRLPQTSFNNCFSSFMVRLGIDTSSPEINLGGG